MQPMRPLPGSLLALGACAGAGNATGARMDAERPNLVAEASNRRVDERQAVNTADADATRADTLMAGKGDLVADDGGYHSGLDEHAGPRSLPSQPLWLDNALTNFAGCKYDKDDHWREQPRLCTCIASDGSVAEDCPRMTPHPGFRGCLWIGVTTHFQIGSRRIDPNGVECICTGTDDTAVWDCRRPLRVRPI
jgi:hypothetical protein